MEFFGKFLILFGALWLLQNLGFLPQGVWDIFWPIVLILVGLHLLWPGHWHKFWKEVGGKKINIE